MALKILQTAGTSTRSEYGPLMAAALGSALGWEVTDDKYVQHPNSNLKFYFSSDSNYGYVGVYNASSGMCSQVAANTTSGMYVFYDVTDYSIIVGTGTSTEYPYFYQIITTNTAGDYIGLHIQGAKLYWIPNEGSRTDITNGLLPLLNSSLLATSIMRLPDIVNGSVLRDLYVMYSCPYYSTKTFTFTIGGKLFRAFCVSSSSYNYYLAAPES